MTLPAIAVATGTMQRVAKEVARPAEGVLFQPALSEALTRLADLQGGKYLCIAGPPGCGQGVAARNLAAVTGEESLLVKCLAAELTDPLPSGAIRRLRAAWRRAKGGVLRLTPLESLLSDPNAVPVLHSLRDLIRQDPDVSLVLDGDRESVAKLHALSPELYSAFEVVHVSPFTPRQMAEILMAGIARERMGFEPGFKEGAEALLRKNRGVGDLVNGRVCRALARQSIRAATADARRQVRLVDLDTRPLRTVDFDGRSGFGELDLLIGLSDVKDTVRQWAANSGLMLRREQLGLAAGGGGQHMVFKGPAGTAKTTVARIVGRILAETGVLSSGHLVETQRSDLIGEHSEQTMRRVTEAVKRALGGVLFIDEAYTLTAAAGGRDPGREAVDTLLKLMEDYRDEFIVVAAGYPVHMEQFLNANPGLRSRFVRVLEFPAYDTDELLSILEVLTGQRGFKLHPGVSDILRPDLDLAQHYPGFGNGRHMRNLLDMAIVRQATRLSEDAGDEELRQLTPEDFMEPRSAVSSAVF